MDPSVVGLSAFFATAPLSFLVLYLHPKIAWVVVVVGHLLPLTQIALPIDTRLAAIPAVAAQGLALMAAKGPAAHGSPPRSVAGLLAMTMVFVGSAAWSVAPARTLSAALAWILLLAALFVFSQVLSLPTMRDISLRIASLVLLLSALAVVLGAPWAFAGGRATGVLTNANGIGVLCALTVPWLLDRPRSRTRWVGLGVATLLLLMSGSRAGALGAVLGVLVVAWRSGLGRMRLLLALVSAATVWGLSGLDFADLNFTSSLFRTNNSREDLWVLSMEHFSDQPYRGIGFGALDLIGGSSYVKLAAELGVLGIALAIAVMAPIIRRARESSVALGTAIAGLANAAFESWLMAAGSFYSLLFFTAVLTIDSGEDESHDSMGGKHADTSVRASPKCSA